MNVKISFLDIIYPKLNQFAYSDTSGGKDPYNEIPFPVLFQLKILFEKEIFVVGNDIVQIVCLSAFDWF